MTADETVLINAADKNGLSAPESSRHMAEPVDVVITWVDGDDPRHRAKREALYTGARENLRDDIAGETRFRSVGEIEYCICSIHRFAPFVRKIFIVTDSQDPHVERVIDRYFKSSAIPVEIVDHTVIFRGYEEYLPMFSGRAIETMLWRIPGLSERFVFFNDDFMLIAPISVDDWFDNRGRSVAYGYWHNTITAVLGSVYDRITHPRGLITFRDGQLNAALTAGRCGLWRFVRIVHAPQPALRSVFEDFFTRHPGMMRRNLRHHFRHPSLFTPFALYHRLATAAGRGVVRSNQGNVLFLQPLERGHDKFEEYMARLRADDVAKFLCVNSLDQATPGRRKVVTDWLDSRIGVKLSK